MTQSDLQIPVRDTEETRTLLGPLDSNARLVRELFGVNVLSRDGAVRLLGSAQGVAQVAEVFELGLERLRGGRDLETAEVARMLRRQAGAPEPRSQNHGGGGNTSTGPRPEPLPDPVARTRPQPRPKAKARTAGQAAYLAALDKSDVVFAVGPAGTGKTFLAVAAALEAMRAGEVRRMVLVRPAVEAGEKLGYLPGDFQAKVDPYLRPLYDAIGDLVDARDRARFLEGDAIEVCPLAYMRGRTLNNSFVILDEAQNTTVPQMMMFLTRLGEGSRMVVTGDPSQVDLPERVTSGLSDAVRRLEGVSGVSVVQLDNNDVVRHPVVQRILDVYDDGPASSARDTRRDGRKRRK